MSNYTNFTISALVNTTSANAHTDAQQQAQIKPARARAANQQPHQHQTSNQVKAGAQLSLFGAALERPCPAPRATPPSLVSFPYAAHVQAPPPQIGPPIGPAAGGQPINCGNSNQQHLSFGPDSRGQQANGAQLPIASAAPSSPSTSSLAPALMGRNWAAAAAAAQSIMNANQGCYSAPLLMGSNSLHSLQVENFLSAAASSIPSLMNSRFPASRSKHQPPPGEHADEGSPFGAPAPARAAPSLDHYDYQVTTSNKRQFGRLDASEPIELANDEQEVDLSISGASSSAQDRRPKQRANEPFHRESQSSSSSSSFIQLDDFDSIASPQNNGLDGHDKHQLSMTLNTDDSLTTTTRDGQTQDSRANEDVELELEGGDGDEDEDEEERRRRVRKTKIPRAVSWPPVQLSESH